MSLFFKSDYMYNGYEREILEQKEKTFIIISTTANLEFAVISGVLKLVKARLVFFFNCLKLVRNFLEKILQ